jgi:anti-sigma factor RsiW
MVRLEGLEWRELGKALVAALAGGAAATFALHELPLGNTHTDNFVRLVIGSAAWLLVIAAVLMGLRSALPAAVLRRKAAAVQPTTPDEAADAPDRN